MLRALTPLKVAGGTPPPPWSNLQSLTCNNGASKYVDFGDVTAIDFNSIFSISMWVKLASGIEGLITKYNGVGWEISDNAGSADFGFFGNGTTCYITFLIPLASWQHLVITGNGTDAAGYKVYLNGAPATFAVAANSPGGSTLSNAPLQIGARNGGIVSSSQFNQATMWDSELSLSDVQALYNSGTPNNPAAQSFSSHLLHAWPLDNANNDPTVILDTKGSDNGTGVNLVTGDFTNDVP